MSTWRIEEGLDKKDKVNAITAGQKLPVDEKLVLLGCGITEKTDNETGEIREIGVLKTDKGTFACISSVIINAIDAYADLLADGDTVEFKVVECTANSGRKFLNLLLI